MLLTSNILVRVKERSARELQGIVKDLPRRGQKRGRIGIVLDRPVVNDGEHQWKINSEAAPID